MSLVHNGFLTFRFFAALSAARPDAGLTAPAGRYLASTNGVRDSEFRPSWSRQRASQGLPGSVFDARYEGLTAHAARLDAAICRHERLR